MMGGLTSCGGTKKMRETVEFSRVFRVVVRPSTKKRKKRKVKSELSFLCLLPFHGSRRETDVEELAL